MTRAHGSTDERGFALLVTVILTAALLASAGVAASVATSRASAQSSLMLWRSQARSLADGCAEAAAARLLGNPAYDGGEEVILPTGSCRVTSVRHDDPSPGTTAVEATGKTHGASASVTVIGESRARCLSSSPAPFGMRLRSWIEVPAHE